jgi:excisionase family DNA binding protein
MNTECVKSAFDQVGSPWPIKSAARHLGISDKHLRRLIDAGFVRVIRFGRRVFLANSELRRLAEEGAGRPAAEVRRDD